MDQLPTNPSIFISAAEQSGDEHAAGFIHAFLQRCPGASFAGLAGSAMRLAGCECFHDMTAKSAMALAAVRRLPEGILLLGRLRGYLSAQHFDAAVLVDSPTINLPIAKLCRRRRIPVLYYIAPQTWAWASWRNARIRRRVDRLACIWPFEEQWFQAAGIPAVYVGHPLFDRLLAQPIDQTRVDALRAGAWPVITLLPGSRRHVVREVLPGQLEVARSLAARFKRARFLVVPANEELRREIASLMERSSRSLPIEVLSGSADRTHAIRAADLALVASGTVTLEVAYHATPMIVMYNASRWLYGLVGRHLISTRHLSIPNILAGRRIVPEFMPYYRSVDPIVAVAVEWLSNPASLPRIRAELRDLIQPIVRPGAAANAAAELAALLERSAPTEPPQQNQSRRL
jgi:lipid-A-disaccharide synthase